MTARQFFWCLWLHLLNPRWSADYIARLQAQSLRFPEIDSSLIPMKERQCS